ncbi:hypothetical protein MAH4_23010 [Sessilibacter sp. MAH4]
MFFRWNNCLGGGRNVLECNRIRLLAILSDLFEEVEIGESYLVGVPKDERVLEDGGKIAVFISFRCRIKLLTS